jgi:hypothetical protein
MLVPSPDYTTNISLYVLWRIADFNLKCVIWIHIVHALCLFWLLRKSRVLCWETCDPSAHQEVRNLCNPKKFHYRSLRFLVSVTWILSTSPYPFSLKLFYGSRKRRRLYRFSDWKVYFSYLPRVINFLPTLFRCLRYFYFINWKLFRMILKFCRQNSGI